MLNCSKNLTINFPNSLQIRRQIFQIFRNFGASVFAVKNRRGRPNTRGDWFAEEGWMSAVRRVKAAMTRPLLCSLQRRRVYRVLLKKAADQLLERMLLDNTTLRLDSYLYLTESWLQPRGPRCGGKRLDEVECRARRLKLLDTVSKRDRYLRRWATRFHAFSLGTGVQSAHSNGPRYFFPRISRLTRALIFHASREKYERCFIPVFSFFSRLYSSSFFFPRQPVIYGKLNAR